MQKNELYLTTSSTGEFCYSSSQVQARPLLTAGTAGSSLRRKGPPGRPAGSGGCPCVLGAKWAGIVWTLVGQAGRVKDEAQEVDS